MSMHTSMLAIRSLAGRLSAHKHVVAFAVLGSLATTACGTGSQATTAANTPSAEAVLAAGRDTFVKHWNAGDAQSLANEFTPDAIRVISDSKGVVVGSAAIKRSFEDTFRNGSVTSKSRLSADISHARFLSANVVIGAGTFRIVDSNDKVIRSGKWGNTYKYENGQVKFLMESAYISEADNPSLIATEATALGASLVSTDVNVGKVQASVDQYVKHDTALDFESISRLFSEDGIRSVSSVPVAVGRDAIKNSFRPGSVRTALKANILGYRDLGNSIAIAYGQWQNTNDKGEVLASGQWGNVFKLEATQAILLMESAGVLSK